MKLTISNTGTNAVKVSYTSTTVGGGLQEVEIASGASQDFQDLPGKLDIRELGLDTELNTFLANQPQSSGE